MAHNLFRLATQVLNSPQLITESAFQPIAQYLKHRNSDSFFMDMKPEKDDEEDNEEEDDIEVIGGIAIIDVEGPLTFKPQKMMCMPDTTSYEGLIEQTQEAIELGCQTIVYQHSSPGGQAFACFDTAEQLRKMLNEANVKSIAYVLEGSFSASYLLAVICDEVIIHPEASVGSIGCCVCLSDDSKADEMSGHKDIYISFPQNKIPYNEDGSFKDKFLKKIDEDVTRLGTNFASHVSKFTGLSVEAILALDGQSFYSQEALDIGLVNKIMSQSDFINYLTRGVSNA